jgi:uracil-DNA glycosylase
LTDEEFAGLLAEVRACRLCQAHLPLGPRPILRAALSDRLMIVGQAPGTKVHQTGIPWNDRSGDRLREWLTLDRDAFYDERRIAVIPAGFCYPGRLSGGGDRPPRPECAATWHPRLNPALTEVRLTLLVGTYAQALYLGRDRRSTMTATVRAFREYLPRFFPLPHPSWRTTHWERQNPWFTLDLLPELRARVQALL